MVITCAFRGGDENNEPVKLNISNLAEALLDIPDLEVSKVSYFLFLYGDQPVLLRAGGA
jgi:hypothetical protein